MWADTADPSCSSSTRFSPWWTLGGIFRPWRWWRRRRGPRRSSTRSDSISPTNKQWSSVEGCPSNKHNLYRKKGNKIFWQQKSVGRPTEFKWKRDLAVSESCKRWTNSPRGKNRHKLWDQVKMLHNFLRKLIDFFFLKTWVSSWEPTAGIDPGWSHNHIIHFHY